MSLKLIVDNMPINAVPVYDCDKSAVPMFCQINITKNRSKIESKMVKAKKDTDGRRYRATLYEITTDVLQGIANALTSMEFHKSDMSDVVLCIRGKEIGLIKHSSIEKS